ncbi:hypothetical protein ACFV3R_25290 [Streptomyces sp. NPDC059740]|uniref:hypothetical protein n=1 Tax=Streptomyces sp. NPDC059740 TaxID=3346926 RepID=UPI003668447A
MRRRRVGAAAVCAATVLALGGCSGTGQGDGKASARPAPASKTAEPSEEPTPEETWPDTPAGRLDKLADAKGWLVDGDTASAYVDDICESMSVQKAHGNDPAEWLMVSQTPDSDERQALKAGMPGLCSKWWPAVRKALGGDFVHTYTDGTYVVKAKPKDFLEQIAPGTYRTTDPDDGCYWERTSSGGGILANQYATSARAMTVTVRASDGQFTSRGCGTWKPVK